MAAGSHCAVVVVVAVAVAADTPVVAVAVADVGGHDVDSAVGSVVAECESRLFSWAADSMVEAWTRGGGVVEPVETAPAAGYGPVHTSMKVPLGEQAKNLTRQAKVQIVVKDVTGEISSGYSIGIEEATRRTYYASPRLGYCPCPRRKVACAAEVVGLA